MDLKWLEDFLVLAHTRSFSAAARERNVTQPAFSRRIQSLELWAGVALIDRSSYPVTLTAAGRKLRETAEETIRLLAASRDDLRVGGVSAQPTVLVAALHSLAAHFFPHWLHEMLAKAGPFNSRLLATDYQTCVAAMSDGECDFLLTYGHADVPFPLDAAAFPYLVVGSDSLVEVHAPGWTPNTGSVLRYSAESFLGRLTLSLRPHDEAEQALTHISENAMAEELKGMVLAAHGAAWLPLSMVQREIADGRLNATGREVALEIRLYRNADRRRPLIGAIWSACGYAAAA